MAGEGVEDAADRRRGRDNAAIDEEGVHGGGEEDDAEEHGDYTEPAEAALGLQGFAGAADVFRERSPVRMLLLRVDALLAKRVAVGGHGAVFIKAAEAGVSADNAPVKDAAREFLEAFGFQRLQIADADARGDGDVVERDAAALPLRP